MFHWICPECGREIPPAVTECPACDPRALAAEAAKTAPVADAVAPPPPPPPVVENKPAEAALPVAAEPVAPAESIAPAPAAAESVAAELPVAEPVASAEPVAAEPVAAEPVALESGAAEPVAPAPAETANSQVEETAAAEPVSAEPQPIEAQAAEPQAVETKLVEPQTIAAQAVEPQVAQPQPAQPAAEIQIAETKPVEPQLEEPEAEIDPLLVLAESIQEVHSGPRVTAKPEPQATPVANATAGLADLAAAIGVVETPVSIPAAAEPVSVAAATPVAAISVGLAAPPQPMALLTAAQPVALLAPPAPPVQPVIPQASAPEPVIAPPPIAAAVADAVQAPPPPAPSSAAPVEPSVEHPPSGSWLNLAPLQNYKAATRHSLQPATLPAKIVAHDTGPRITLPGPTLPPDLVSLQETGVVTVLGDPAKAKKSGGLPGWMVSFLVTMGLLIAGVVVVFYFSPLSHPSADAKPPAQDVEVPTVAPVAHSLADTIEVTGFRILVDYNKKSEIHYLVVNHSPNELSDVTVYVTLHAAGAKPGQPPLCRFSFKSPGLKAFEVKEMTASIEKFTRSVTLPDWQDLRAEVQVAP